MSRYIDADDFFETFEELDKEPYINYPASDVRENVEGEWQACRLDGQEWYVSCSNCHVVMPPVNYNFCPNCGANMRGEAEGSKK